MTKNHLSKGLLSGEKYLSGKLLAKKRKKITRNNNQAIKNG
ncbi:hypothetical protein B194_0641 [Serratia plymuthica A30]|nr:hypothetical protein B194_0641 [Serratia plymuthica A30]